MKIAYILPSLKNTGPVIVAKSLVDALVTKGCIADVFYFDELPAMNFKCPTYHITMNTKIPFDDYDIIHSHCLRPDKYVIRWKKHIHTAKLVTTLHQDTYHSFCYQYNVPLSAIFTWYWCNLQSQFDAVISISNQLKDTYIRRIKANITTIYNGCPIHFDAIVDDSIIDKLHLIKKEYKLLGAYAFVTRRKGLEQVLHSLVYLQDYAFALIGEGPDISRLKKIALDLNISNRVFFFPYQKSPRNYLSYFDIYTMTSYSEGFGLSMVEAALARKSIVCSDIPSFHEIFPNKEVSFFELSNIDSLLESIKKAYEKKNELGELAYQRALEDFTIEKMVQNHLEYYKQIIV